MNNFNESVEFIYSYFTNRITRFKKNDLHIAIHELSKRNYNLDDLKKVLDNSIFKIVQSYKFDKEFVLYVDFFRNLLINNYDEPLIKNFTIENYQSLFLNKVLRDEDYKYFKDAFLKHIRRNIFYNLNRFKYFKEFVDLYYHHNSIKDTNYLLSQIFILRNCSYVAEYIQDINSLKLKYTIDAFLLINYDDVHVPQNDMFFLFGYTDCLHIIENIFDSLQFNDVNKLNLTKVIKHHGFSLFTILLLIKSIRNYKLIPPEPNLILELIKEHNTKYKFEGYLDKYTNEYFTLCFDKNYYKPVYELLNKCAELNIKMLFKTLINNYNIKPDKNTLDTIIIHAYSFDIDNLNLLLGMKFILTNEHINLILKTCKFNNKLRKLLIDLNYVNLNDNIFEDYIKYENYIFKDKHYVQYKENTCKDKKNKLYKDSYEFDILNEFTLDKTLVDKYFDIIHKNNKYSNYKIFEDFLCKKLFKNKKDIRKILEFTKSKYKSTNDYKKLIDEKKDYINKYSLDMCMKSSNYDAGIYIIEKYNVKPDIYTSLFIKDMDKRVLFYNKYFI